MKPIYYVLGGAAAIGVGALAFKRINEKRVEDNIKKLKDLQDGQISDGNLSCQGWVQATVKTLVTRLNIRNNGSFDSQIIGKLEQNEKIWVRLNETPVGSCASPERTKEWYWCDWLQYGGKVGSVDINGVKCSPDGFVYAGYVIL